jgi:hypothetical protein
MHSNRKSIDSFLLWLNSKSSALHKQKSLNKNQIQGLLLGIGLALRDLEFVNFVDDYEETPVPAYLIKSTLAAKDLSELEKAMRTVQEVVQNHFE